MNKLRDYLNRDVKEFNVKILVLSGILFIALMGFISYKLTNSSYALFTNEVTGTKTLTLHYEAPKVVTFDPDGGIIPEGTDWTGSGNTATKDVILGLTYGELPEPTKEGYTFKGWNGKNLVNIDNFTESYTDDYYKEYVSSPKYVLEADTTLTLSFNYKINSNSNNVFASVGYGNTGYYRDIKYGSNYSGVGRYSLAFTTPNSFDYNPPYLWYRFVRMGSKGSANVDISNIQLEEGSTVTEYEPYYIAEDTKVVQTTNHTLKAIWEENE